MNILQITNYECASMSANDNTGINRVVTALCEYYVNVCHDFCFNAYYIANPLGLSEIFTNSYHLTASLDRSTFRSFLIENNIKIIVNNVSNVEYVNEIAKINKIAHECGVRTIYSIHFMPGYEACSYAAFSMVYYNGVHHTKFLDTLKKWIITVSRPISAPLIRKAIYARYALPLQTSDKVSVLSQDYISNYLAITHSTEQDKFVVNHNPLPFAAHIEPHDIIKKEKEVIIVGRLYEPTKRLSYALRVWKMVEKDTQLKDWKLTIIGEGASSGYYQWLAQRFGLQHVYFVGHQDPLPYYQKASILLTTSIHEGWPMVLMECMPMGVVPCVFNSYGSATEIIDHGVNGMVAPENDLLAYYSHLKDLMLNENKRQFMANAAIEKSQSFDMSIIGRQWRTLLDNTINN